MTDKMIEVPRELLEELRDCACDCMNYEQAKGACANGRVAHEYYEIMGQADAILRAPTKEAVTPAAHTDNEGEQRACGGCDWVGPVDECRMLDGRALGSIGPLCPKCGETTEALSPADETCPHCGSHPGDLTVAWMDGAHCATKKAQSKPDDLEAMRRDAELLDWLDANCREHFRDGGDVFVWRLRSEHPNIRAAIAAEKREG